MSQQHIANTDTRNPVPELGNVCERCSRRFGRNYHFKYHLKVHERRDKFKKCLENVFNNVISESQQQCQNLTVNLQGSEVNVNAQDISDEALKSQDTLEISKTLTDVPTHACQQCDKVFKVKADLTRHHKIHEGEREKSHVCQRCSARFVINANLQRHLKIHERRDKIEERLKNDFNEIFQLQQQCHNLTVNPQETEVNVNAQEIAVEALKSQDTLETSKTLVADNKDPAYDFS
ncbi:unnamed protein product [Orchesella dallaii]|uniref:C2H2-type domain-containing protein n=1 Tax=Orchesella dallaii TaxID=48710 RepID=A0ABP1S2M1_9HEXA